MIDFLAALDAHLFISLHDVTHSAFLNKAMMLYTDRFIWIPMYAAMAWFLLRTYGVTRALYCLVAIGIVITLTDQTCATVIRPLVERLRPANLDNPLSKLVHIVNGYRGGAYGFPSCHAANTFALATFFVLLTRKWGISIFIYAWAITNCYTRVYLGVHYPGDLLAGATVGSLKAIAIYFILNHFIKYEKTDSERNFLPTYVVAALTIVGICVAAAIC